MQKIFSLIVVLSFLVAAPGVLAQETELPDPGLTPDSTFYFLKTWKEAIQTFFTFEAENKAKQFLHLSEVRLAEYQKMIEKGKIEIAQKTLEKYERQLNQALEKAEKAKEKGKDVENLVTLISEKTLKHQEVLSEVHEKVPEEAKKGIEKAIEMSQRGFENAIQAVSEEKKAELEKKAEEIKVKVETVDWKIYTNEEYGYSFKYPPDCFYGPMPVYCKEKPPEERPSECLCFLNGENPDEAFLQAYIGEKDRYGDLVLATFSVSHYMTHYFNPPLGTDLVSWLKEKFSNLHEDIPDKPNTEIGGTPAVKFYTPRSPQAFSGETIYFIKNDKLFVISMIDVDSASNRKLYNQILSTFKFIEIEEVKEKASKIEEVPKIEEKPIAPTTPALETPVLTDPGISVNKHEPFTLNWTSVSGAKRYALQRGTSTDFPIGPPPWISEVNSDTDNPGVGTSLPEVTTTYYYRVKACDDRGCGAWSNVVDMKVIVPVPSITVISPNGGERFDQGANITITWDSKGVDYVDIDLLDWGRKQEDGSVPFILDLATNYSASKGTYAWKIYSDWPTGNLYKIRVASSDNLIKDISDNYFSIIEGAVNVEFKNTNDTIYRALRKSGEAGIILRFDAMNFADETVIINELVIGNESANSNLQVFDENTYYLKVKSPYQSTSRLIDTKQDAPNSYRKFKVEPAIEVGIKTTSLEIEAAVKKDVSATFIGNTVHVVLSNVNGYGSKTKLPIQSDIQFDSWARGEITIEKEGEKSIIVLSPNGGEVWEIGKTYTIQWKSNNLPAGNNIDIELMGVTATGSTVRKTLFSSLPNNYTSVNWLIPADISGKYQIRVISYAFVCGGRQSTCLDDSDAPFSIVAATQPSITVLSPNGGETWVKGNTYDITWKSSGVENVHIDIAKYDVPSTGGTIISNIPASTGKYSWTVPDLPSGDNYKIRVFTYPLPPSGGWKEGVNYDQSDSYFTILPPPPPEP